MHKAVMFLTSYLFKDTVKEVYEKRKQLKSEGDQLQTVFKLVMNSFYGSTNMKNTAVYKFTTDPDSLSEDEVVMRTLTKVGEGYYRVKSREQKEFFKPNQIGVFTLSAARMFMHLVALHLGFF